MKIFPLSSLAWMIITCTIYVSVGFANLFYNFAKLEYIQAVWIFVMALPIYIPLKPIVNFDPFWKWR